MPTLAQVWLAAYSAAVTRTHSRYDWVYAANQAVAEYKAVKKTGAFEE